MHPDRVVIGADAGDEWAADAVEDLYRPLGGELVRTDVASAEMIKLASNAFLATKISFINEIANVCEEVGADVTEVARGMGLDGRIGPSFLRAGIGYGGLMLSEGRRGAQAARRQLRLPLPAAQRGDRGQRAPEAARDRKLEKHLGSLVGKRIALLGLAFKPDTDDMREATSLVLAARLQGEGAVVGAYDPVAEARGAASCCRASSSRDSPRRRSTAPTRRCWSPSGPSSPSSTGPALAGRMANAAGRRRAQLPRPGGAPRRRLRLRGHRPAATRRPSVADAGRGARRRGGHPPAPADADRPKPAIAARRPAVHPLHGRLAGTPRGRARW